MKLYVRKYPRNYELLYKILFPVFVLISDFFSAMFLLVSKVLAYTPSNFFEQLSL